MLQNMWTTFITEKSLFIKLFVEHIEIPSISMLGFLIPFSELEMQQQ